MSEDAPTGEELRAICAELLPMLTPYGREFVDVELGRGEQAYRDRLRFIGLDHQGHVLDAGGGLGQWACALARTNDKVEVVDLMPDRLMVGHLIAKTLRLGNINFRYGSIEALPYADGNFDAVICYSVMMFTNGQRTGAEFARVLKPGGRLYVMIDLWRWYAQMYRPPRKWREAVIMTAKSALGRGTRLYTPKSFDRLLRDAGFEIVSHGQEGWATFETSRKGDAGKHAFFGSKRTGREQLWEVCAIRR